MIGPESTGKTTLTEQLARYYQTSFVPEYAREYIQQLERSYEEKDLLEIAKVQIHGEEAALQQANKYLFCDTDLQVIKVWSLNSYGRCHPWILQQIAQRHYDFYFLCGIDVPWAFDPQREHPDPHWRTHFYNIYQQELQSRQLPFAEITGNPTTRLRTAIDIIEQMK